MNPHHRNAEFKYCPVCGGTTRATVLNEHEKARPVCSRCGYIIYLDPKVVACTLVEVNGGILMLRRATAPGKGKWAVPGGFVDRGEPVEAAAVRETWEECGIMVRIDALAGVYSYRNEIPVVIFYEASIVSGEPEAGEECLEIRVFPPHDIPWEDLAFTSTAEALEKHLERRTFSNKKVRGWENKKSEVKLNDPNDPNLFDKQEPTCR
jgi:ADP-ribose pyrophosphatase YjhB (NUDIX family)